MMRVLIIIFCPLRLSISLPFEQYALHGVWSARCACTRTETSSLFAVFVISSIPLPSSRLGPIDKYDGDAQTRKSSAGALQLGAAQRLLPFANSFAVLQMIFFLFSPFSCPAAQEVRLDLSFHFSHVDHLCVHSPTRHLFFVGSGTRKVERETLAYPQCHSHEAAASICVPRGFFPASALCASRLPERGSFSRCELSLPSPQVPRCCSEQSPKCPNVSQNFPICSLRVACAATSLSRMVDSFFSASFLLDVRWRLKNF